MPAVLQQVVKMETDMYLELDETLDVIVTAATTSPSGHNVGGKNAVDAVLRMMELLGLASWQVNTEGALIWKASKALQRLASQRVTSEVVV